MNFEKQNKYLANSSKNYIVDSAGRSREKNDLDLPHLNSELINEQNKISQRLAKLSSEKVEEFKELSKIEASKITKLLGLDDDFQGKSGLEENFENKKYLKKDYLMEHKDLLRQFVYFYENIIAPKAKMVGMLSEQRDAAYNYLTEIEAHLLKPRNESEKFDGYNFILESFILQKMSEKLNESNIKDWSFMPATAEQDFFAGTDFKLIYSGSVTSDQSNHFVIGIDLGLGTSFKAYWKKIEKTDLSVRKKQSSECDFIVAYNPIIDGIGSKMEEKTFQDNIIKQEEWHNLAKKITENVSQGKTVNDFKMPMSANEQIKIIINKAMDALNLSVTGDISNAKTEVIKQKLIQLKNRFDFENIDKKT